MSLRLAESLPFSWLTRLEFSTISAIVLQLLPEPAWWEACAPGTEARMGVLVMNTPERKGFYYSWAWAVLVGGLLFAMGAAFIAIFAHELLRLSPSGRQPPDWFYVWLILGVPCAFGGLLYISRTISDRRPVLVLDSEGVFYRPYGNAIVPWRDIRAVELDDRDSEFSYDLILTRRSGRPVSIDLFELWPTGGSGGKYVAHRAILDAWEAACARGAEPATAGCETNTPMGGMVSNAAGRTKFVPPANTRMAAPVIDDAERQKFYSPRFPRIILGGIFFLGGLPCVLVPSLLLLGFREFPYAAPLAKPLSPDFTADCGWTILIGLLLLASGLFALWEGLDWRPKAVVDSEGVYYRSAPNGFIPWRDIRAVELDRRSRGSLISVDDKRIFLVRRSGLPVTLEGLKASAYRAIVQAWQRHGGKA